MSVLIYFLGLSDQQSKNSSITFPSLSVIIFKFLLCLGYNICCCGND